MNKDCTDVAVLELYRSIRAAVEFGLERAAVRCLAVALAGKLQRQHVEVVCDDGLNFFPRPIHPQLLLKLDPYSGAPRH